MIFIDMTGMARHIRALPALTSPAPALLERRDTTDTGLEGQSESSLASACPRFRESA